MKTIKLFLSNLLLVVLIVVSFNSCQETQLFPLIESIPCEDSNVTPNPNIINDFNCQTNRILPNVETVLSPDESGINTSRFVGKYTDPTGPWDALIIDYGAAINLATYNTFKIKVKTAVAGTLKAKLEGGSSNGFEVDATISNTTNWVEYSFDFSNQFNQNHTKLILFFNAGVETNGTDTYYIDELRWETT
ncbi:MAG: hypothetical protein COX71_07520, partial [Flavobacteriales bacterium CG_4_10_14_0_2_um_filter_35_18]